MSNLTTRIVTGIVLILVITGCVLAGAYTFILLLFILNILGLLEFYRLFRLASLSPPKFTGLVLSILILVSLVLFQLHRSDERLFLAVIPMAFLIFVLELYRKSTTPFQNLGITFLGILCITIPLSLFLISAFVPWQNKVYQPAFILAYFLLLWASDSGAYLIGKRFGRHKLFPRISPNKTWEGSIGGVVCALAVAFLNARFSGLLSINHWLAMAIVVVVFGTLGDLIKSMMKRSLGIKDSGTILPGHGGIIDRFDSLLGSAPFVFLYLVLFHYE